MKEKQGKREKDREGEILERIVVVANGTQRANWNQRDEKQTF